MFYETIIENKTAERKQLAILIDPDKQSQESLSGFIDLLEQYTPDYIFVGGSFVYKSLDDCIKPLKASLNVPVVLFPGNAAQFSPQADALLFLSLLSGRNADYLIGQHVKAALNIKKSAIEVVPTAYLLIESGEITAVERASHTQPISRKDIEIAVSTALAGQYMGNKLIYLEGGSGAKRPVPMDMIRAVKNSISIPLIVGGGLKTKKDVENAFSAGADMVVVGNALESNLNFIKELIEVCK